MGLLDTIAGEVLKGLQGQGSGSSEGGALLEAAIGMLQGGAQGGGLGSLVQQFEQAGLDNIVQSWISTGQNLPISADQLRSALGSDTVNRMAQQAGVSADQGLGALVELLPQLVDRLTPNGRVQEGNDVLAVGLDLLRKTLA
jgi:uncharacterized protein YidB (DUF937 family)